MVGAEMPVMLGRGGSVVPDVVEGRKIKESRQTPNPSMTDPPLGHVVATQLPAFNTFPEDESQLRQPPAPAAEQLEQDPSQVLQVPEAESKNSFCAQVGRHREEVRTGRVDGHVEHCVAAGPEHVRQSG